MIRIGSVGRGPRPPSFVCSLSQVCDVVVEPQVLIPKESHLLDQLIRSIWWRSRWLLRRRQSRGLIAPLVCDIFHVASSWSCACDQACHRDPRVIPRVSWIWG